MNSSIPGTGEIDDTVKQFGAEVSETVSQAGERAQELGRKAADAIDQRRGGAASGLESAASTLRSGARRLPGGERVADIAQTAADRLSSTADYVRDHDVDSMMADVEGVVRRNPGPALLMAVAVGFLIGRSLSRD